MTDQNKQIHQLASEKYRYGFETPITTDTAPKGINEDIICLISAKKRPRRRYCG